MDQKLDKFYLAKNGEQVGPYSVDEILSKIHAEEHTWMDYIYDQQQNDWILLMEHPLLTKSFNSSFTKPITSHQEEPMVDDLKERAWYVLKDGNNYGPFSRLELVQMLQTKTLFEYDFVWHHNFKAWKRLAETEEFSPDRIKELKEINAAEVNEIFFRRRHMRAQYGCSLIIHNNKAVFKGKSLEISAGGAGVLIENSDFQPGQNLYLHFKPGDGVPPFNATCQIVSKQFVDPSRNASSALRYGVKFINVSPATREAIRSYTEKKVAA